MQPIAASSVVIGHTGMYTSSIEFSLKRLDPIIVKCDSRIGRYYGWKDLV